jgi:hypothetical protein
MDLNINEEEDIIEAARAYLREGVSVVLLHGPVKGSDGILHCSCLRPDCTSPVKHPIRAIHPQGPNSPITSEDELEAAVETLNTFNKERRNRYQREIIRPNLAIILPRGWAALDLDTSHKHASGEEGYGLDGNQVLLDFIRKHQSWGWDPLLEGPVERTGSGGWHWFVGDLGTTMPSKGIRTTLTGDERLPRVEFKPTGSQLVVAPSCGLSGQRYQWLKPATFTIDPPSLPEQFAELIRASAGRAEIPEEMPRVEMGFDFQALARALGGKFPFRLQRWADATLEKITKEQFPLQAQESCRNNTLYQVIIRLYSLQGCNLISQRQAQAAIDAISNMAQEKGLSLAEVDATVRSAAKQIAKQTLMGFTSEGLLGEMCNEANRRGITIGQFDFGNFVVPSASQAKTPVHSASQSEIDVDAWIEEQNQALRAHMGERFAQASEKELREELAQLWERTGVDKSKLTEIATILTSREDKKPPALANKFMERIVISHRPTVTAQQESQLRLSVDSHLAHPSAPQPVEQAISSAAQPTQQAVSQQSVNLSANRPAESQTRQPHTTPQPTQLAVPQQSVNPPANRPTEAQTPPPNPQPAQQTIRRAVGENLEHREQNPMLTPQQHKVFEGAIGYAGKIEHWTQLANELDVPVGTVQKIWDEARQAILEETLTQTHNMAPDQLMEKVGLPKAVADAMCNQELRWNRDEAQQRQQARETQQAQGRQQVQDRQQVQEREQDRQQAQDGQQVQDRRQAQQAQDRHYAQRRQQVQQRRQTQYTQHGHQAQETQHNQERPVQSPQLQKSHLLGQPEESLVGQPEKQTRPMRQMR